jgi:transposase InsO family protein
VKAHRQEVKVVRLCRTLGVSRSGFYAFARRPEGKRSRERRELLGVIRRIHDEVDQVYGAPRMKRELEGEGLRCGRHRVARIMRAAGLRARRRPRRRPCTTDSRHALPVAPNVLAQDFRIETLDRVWVGDITYVPTGEGWLYLAVLIDLCSRRVVGWALDRTIDRSLTLRALTMALARRKPGPELLHHTDRGSQYAATDYQLELEAAGLRCSMSRKGNCYDNAVAESFFATLKKERVHHRRWRTRDEARSDLFEYIEGFYNLRRRHSALGYRTPVEYEEAVKTA